MAYSALTPLRISDDGQVVAFRTNLGLVSQDTNGESDVYVYDVQAAAVELASVNSNGDAGGGTYFDLSGDGRYVVFAGRGLTPDRTGGFDVYRYDRTMEHTMRVSFSEADPNYDCTVPSVSRNGGVVAMICPGGLLSSDTNGRPDVYAVHIG